MTSDDSFRGFAALAEAANRAARAVEVFGKALERELALSRLKLSCELLKPGIMRDFKPAEFTDPVSVASQVYRLLARGEEEAAKRLLEG